jgi:ubiquinone/menaquinone biosynthesis C-methylase UbiE
MNVSVDPEGREIAAIEELVDLADADVLEVGAGDGRLTWRYAHRARSVVAVDPRASQLGLARREMPSSLAGRVALELGDARTHALPAAAFDVALFSRSL